jgi:hypothetical protein
MFLKEFFTLLIELNITPANPTVLHMKVLQMSNKDLGLIRLKLNQITREAKNRIKYILPFRIYFFIPLIFPK